MTHATDDSDPDGRALQVPYDDRYDPGAPPEVAGRALYDCLRRRRSIREFSQRPVSREAIEWLIRCAGSAPSGANRQPWRFACVSDRRLKRAIRDGAEREERRFYERRASQRWLHDLEPLGTGATKEFLEVAPWLVVVFKRVRDDDGGPVYYPDESVGIAVGILIAAAHQAGLATLPYTPSPMGFLTEILGRPEHERPYLLIPVGYPADGCRVPATAFERRPLEEVSTFHE
jgi:nitroreductase